LARDSLAFVRASDRHRYESDPAASLEFINLAFARAWWRHFAQLFLAPLGPTRIGADVLHRHADLPADSTARLERQMHELLVRGSRDQPLLLETMVVLIRKWLFPVGAIAGARNPPPEWLLGVVRDLQNPELIGKSLSFWQHRSGRSPEHLARSCRRFFGESLTGLINLARVELIKSQMRRGVGKIAMLALDAGYHNLGYFYRVFRRLEGCPPRVWMRTQSRAATVPR
jgi:AraC family cel operon transcriptional repressor